MFHHIIGVLLALILGLFLPYPFGIAVVAGVAVGGLVRLGDRVNRLEALVWSKLGLAEESAFEIGDPYLSERERIRRKMERLAKAQGEEQR